MLNLQQMKEAVDQLSPDELRELRAYLDERASTTPSTHPRSPAERIHLLQAGARAIRESFTDAEWAVVEQAMNEE